LLLIKLFLNIPKDWINDGYLHFITNLSVVTNTTVLLLLLSVWGT